MKFKTLKEKLHLNLQFFAEDDNGESAGDEGGEESEEDEEDESEEEEEAKFTQKDVDAAIEKRLARERRKWARQQKDKSDNGDGKAEQEEPDEKTKKLMEKAAKAEELELKWTALELGVDKSAVSDVIALAQARVAKDKELDIEDAIEKVLEKYPSLKGSSGKSDDDDKENNKSWGERQKGRTKKMSAVEERFYELNPDLIK